MKKGLRAVWCISFAFLLSACGGQENDFSNTTIGNNAHYGAPSGEVTKIEPGDPATIRADISTIIPVPYRQHDPTIPHRPTRTAQ
ncbi:MAG TPA: hypothetical protein PLV42_02455 [bacterium]|nr:hypothetical protein [bacterium]